MRQRPVLGAVVDDLPVAEEDDVCLLGGWVGGWVFVGGGGEGGGDMLDDLVTNPLPSPPLRITPPKHAPSNICHTVERGWWMETTTVCPPPPPPPPPPPFSPVASGVDKGLQRRLRERMTW